MRIAWTVLFTLLAVPWAGCTQPGTDDTMTESFRIVVETVYDTSGATDDRDAQDRGADLPADHPAIRARISGRIQEAPGYQPGSWDHDAPCRSMRPCPDDGVRDVYVLPPVAEADDGMTYPLDAQGRIVFRYPQPVKMTWAPPQQPYSDAMLGNASDPNRCERGDGRPDIVSRGSWYDGGGIRAVHGAQRDGGWIVVSGDARIVVKFYGVCSRAVS